MIKSLGKLPLPLICWGSSAGLSQMSGVFSQKSGWVRGSAGRLTAKAREGKLSTLFSSFVTGDRAVWPVPGHVELAELCPRAVQSCPSFGVSPGLCQIRALLEIHAPESMALPPYFPFGE